MRKPAAPFNAGTWDFATTSLCSHLTPCSVVISFSNIFCLLNGRVILCRAGAKTLVTSRSRVKGNQYQHVRVLTVACAL